MPEIRTADDVLRTLREWLDTDEPLVEAVGETLARFDGVDSQEKARRVVVTIIEVLSHFVVSD